MQVTQDGHSPANDRLIIHCGVQKTGSTSLHHFLRRNRARLAPHLDVQTPQKGSAMRALGRAAMGYSLSGRAEDRAGLRAAAGDVRAACGAGTTLLSHENLLGAMIGKQGVVRLYPRLEEILAVLQEVFGPLRPHLAIYIRDMTDWKRSVFNQAVRSDHYRDSREAFLQQTAECGDWDGLRARLSAAWGPERLSVFRLEDEPAADRPGRQLLRLAGLDASQIDALDPLARRSNESLNAGALEFLRLVNGLDLDRAARSRVADLIAANQRLFAASGA